MTSPSPSDQDRAATSPGPKDLKACPECPHPLHEHSREAGAGCLHVITSPRLLRVLELVGDDGTCDCLRAGTSEADQ